MGKSWRRPRADATNGLRRPAGPALPGAWPIVPAPIIPILIVAGLAGCAHQDVVDTPVSWWHQLQGGAIAEQRPPPPGVNDPYPAIGTTPAHAPPMASVELRRSVTASLLRQRNLTTRLDAADPIPDPVATPAAGKPPGATAAPSPASPASPASGSPASGSPASGSPASGSSASLDAAEAPSAKPGPVAQDQDSEPELAMPALQLQPADASGVAVVLPAIPGAPPIPPRLPGLRVQPGMPAADHPPPDYAVAPVLGTQVAFAAGTDTMLSGQAGVLHAIAARRGAGGILVRGYGGAAAADADTQAQALSVAALRARTVAEALQAEGVPAGAILLRAEAFGRGASVSLVQ